MSVKPWTQFNCYETLQLPATASDAEIRRAFKAASQRAHPDRGGSHEAQIRVNLAYEVLSKPELRAQHDQFWQRRRSSPAARKPASPQFSGDEAVKNLWSGPGAGAAKLSDGKGSSGLSTRIRSRIQRDRDRITLDRENREQIWLQSALVRLKRLRTEALVLVGALALTSVVAALYPLALLGTAGLAWPLWRRLRTPLAETTTGIALWDPLAPVKLKSEAEHSARASVARDRERLELHLKTLERVTKQVAAPVRATDSEGVALRKVLVVLFVLGLLPQRYEPQHKRIVLQGEGETAVLFYHHGVNQALSLATVQQLLAARSALGAKTVYLYNQGGLSKKAGEAADEAGVRWVGLRELNAWAKQVWVSESSGPSGDILQRLVELSAFLDQLPA